MRSVMAGPCPAGTGRSADPDVGLSKRLGASRRPAAASWRGDERGRIRLRQRPGFSARTAASVAPPASVTRLSAMRWMPRPNSCAFLEVRVRVLTPIQAISDDRRPYSIFRHRFITTLRPLASASFAASSLRMPSCIQLTCQRSGSASASSMNSTAKHDASNMSHITMNTATAALIVDALGDVGELGVGSAPQQLLPGESGIDRDHAVALLEQIFEGEVARPAGIGGNPDHRYRLHGVEDAADVAVVVMVVVHAGRLFA